MLFRWILSAKGNLKGPDDYCGSSGARSAAHCSFLEDKDLSVTIPTSSAFSFPLFFSFSFFLFSKKKPRRHVYRANLRCGCKQVGPVRMSSKRPTLQDCLSLQRPVFFLSLLFFSSQIHFFFSSKKSNFRWLDMSLYTVLCVSQDGNQCQS
jgi:hypothetical protein